MAITIQKTTQETNRAAGKPNHGSTTGGNPRNYNYDLPATTVTGDTGSSVDLILVPPGRQTVYLSNSLFEWSAMGASRLTDIGHRAYVNDQGVTVAAALDLFDAQIDTSAAGSAAPGSDIAVNSGKRYTFNSRDGVVLCALVMGGTIPIGEQLHGHFQIGST